MVDYLAEMDELLDMEPDVDTVGNIVEGISQNNVKLIVDTMIDNPRVKSKMKYIGIDLSDAEMYAGLSSALVPAITMFLSAQGERVSGLSAAKTAMKDIVKQKKESIEESTLQSGDTIAWGPTPALWGKSANEMAKEIREHCGTLREALVLLNTKINTRTGMTESESKRIKEAKGKIIRLY